MKKVNVVLLSILMLMSLVPIVGSTMAENELVTYSYPDTYEGELDARYVKVDVDKLDACLYALLNYEGNVEFRIAVKTEHEGHAHVGLMPAAVQKAVICDEDQPEILITVYPGNGYTEDAFLTQLSEQQKKRVEDDVLTVDTVAGAISFPMDAYLHAQSGHPGVTAAATGATTQKPTPTPKPSSSAKPTAMPKPTATPTHKPTATPNTYRCMYCGTSFTNEQAFFHHAWEDPGCYAYGYDRVHATPTPKPTEPPGGHWETVWVVDVPAQGHTEFVCNACGYRSLSESENDSHQKAHALAGESSGWHNESVIDVPEQGHWEKVWVPDP